MTIQELAARAHAESEAVYWAQCVEFAENAAKEFVEQFEIGDTPEPHAHSRSECELIIDGLTFKAKLGDIGEIHFYLVRDCEQCGAATYWPMIHLEDVGRALIEASLCLDCADSPPAPESDPVDALVERYRAALLAELHAGEIAIGEREMAERVKAFAVAEGYDTGAISGKNAEERARGETIYLSGHGDWMDAEDAAFKAEHEVAAAKIERQVVEAQIGLVKANLYGQAQRF